RDDHQVGWLQAAGLRIEVDKAGGDAGDRIRAVEQRVDAVNGFGKNLVDADRAAGLGPRLGNLENQPLSFVEDFLAGAALRCIGAVGDLAADADQFAQRGTLANDPGVGLDVGHRRGVLGQFAEVGQPAHLAQVPFVLQLLGQGYHVERLIALGQGVNGTEDQAMVVAVEIAVRYLVEHTLPGIVVQHQTTQHRLLGLDGMGRHLECGGFQVVLLRGTDVVHGSRNFVASEKNKGHVPLARNVPDVTRPAPKAPNAIVGLAGDYDQSDRSFDIGVQVHSHVVFAGLTDGAVRQADISLGHFNAGGGQGVSDVGGADGAEQFAFIARSCGDGDF